MSYPCFGAPSDTLDLSGLEPDLGPVPPGYERLAAIFRDAITQAAEGKGKERHALPGERFEDQQIVQIGRWLGSGHFQIGQAVKKAIESTRLPRDRARAEVLGAMVYLAADVVLLDEEEPCSSAAR
jgi:hypothetical protein